MPLGSEGVVDASVLSAHPGTYLLRSIYRPRYQKRLTAISTGKDNRDDALIVIAGWLKEGVPQRQAEHESQSRRPLDALISSNQLFLGLKRLDLTAQDVLKIEKILKEKGLVEAIVKKGFKEAETLEDYLKRFWDYDRSPYIADKRSHGINLGKAYARTSSERVVLYWVPNFKGKRIGEVTRQNLKDFSIAIAKKHDKLSPITLRQIMLVGVTALRWAFANELIPNDPTIGLTGYSTKAKKRGVLSPKEAEDLFKLDWKDKRSMLINLVAMTTGLRIGEILALRMEDIGEEYLTIESSFSAIDGLKSTKTDEPRSVPIIPAIRDAMLNFARFNPHGNGYVFFGEKKERPCGSYSPAFELKRMLFKLRAGENPTTEKKKEVTEYWAKRNVVFHSWRHFYASRMTDKLEARKVMLATGHKTESVFKGYSGHALESDLSDVAVITGEVFGGLLPDLSMEQGKTQEATGGNV
ncbi:tyrosine-type recombinase/integrase [Treponema primitia]|uniref:tyrosine-type recombinase/integrase n=1 Tax=Treponema primitia TaxID=88058 RepID=UPI00047497A5|nr:site-specific integrase [Treponema primitia]